MCNSRHPERGVCAICRGNRTQLPLRDGVNCTSSKGVDKSGHETGHMPSYVPCSMSRTSSERDTSSPPAIFIMLSKAMLRFPCSTSMWLVRPRNEGSNQVHGRYCRHHRRLMLVIMEPDEALFASNRCSKAVSKDGFFVTQDEFN